MSDGNSELTLLERLAKADISVVTPVEGEGRAFAVGGRELNFELPESAVLCASAPHYRGNQGFFHIKEGDGECILLKSCYSDSVRIIKKGITLTNEALNGISRVLLQVEGLLEGLFELVFFYSEDQTYIFEVVGAEGVKDAKGDPFIPRPLTALEYCDSQTDSIPDKTLFSRSMLQMLFPEHISFFMETLFKKYPDIFNPFFLSFDAKVDSPSVKCISSCPYLNISAIFYGFREVKVNEKLFGAFYMPWQKFFRAGKQQKAELFISDQTPISDLEEFWAEIEKEYSNKGPYSLYDKNYFDPVVKMAMFAIFLNFVFQEQLAFFADYIKAAPKDALRWIYKTRENSFFFKGEKLAIPANFDLATAAEETEWAPSSPTVDKSVVLSSLSAFSRRFRKKRAFELLDSLHKVADLRDKLLRGAVKYHSSVRKYILDGAKSSVARGKLKYAEQAFMFDTADLRKLSNNTFYGNISPILEYKESLRNRSAAQIMPYELYEVDIPYAGIITEDQYVKWKEEGGYECESYGITDVDGVVASHSDYTGDGDQIYCGRAISLAMTSKLKKPRAVITDIAPAFSYITEYCLINDIPLYYGIRHCELLLAGKRVKLKKDIVEVIDNGSF